MDNTFEIKHLLINFDDASIKSYGADIKIDNMAVDVLKLLIENSGQTVHNDILMEKVWHDKPSSPEVIPAAISRLRKMFKKTGVGNKLITTVHKVGYKLDLPNDIRVDSVTKLSSKPFIKNALWLALAVIIITSLIVFIYKDRLFNFGIQHTNAYPNSVSKLIKSDKTTQLYILRHTEKESSEIEDPVLSQKGIEHAKYWGRVLQNIDFDEIYTTNYKRNIQTAELVSGKQKNNLKFYYPMSFEVIHFLEKVKGKKVLIIGHSNTIPDMVNRLISNTQYPPMSHLNYNLLYLVTISSNGEISSILLDIEQP